jgi:hypothetical protein
MRYLVDPQSLVFKAKGYIAGFNEMVKNEEIPQWDLLEIAMEVAEEWTNEWDEGQGFGSSDGTYMLKDFIDNVIWKYAGGKFETKFTPSLSIVGYSEAEHHNMVQRMESGI